MPVILGFLALLSGLAFFIWRARNAVDASREIVSAADDAVGKVRYWWFKRNYNKHPLQLLDDPREAAVAWMVALAQDDGAISERELAVINSQMKAVLEIDNPAEVLARARWATRSLADVSLCAKHLSPLIRAKLGDYERGQLADMLAAVAQADGETSAEHAALLARWRGELLRKG